MGVVYQIAHTVLIDLPDPKEGVGDGLEKNVYSLAIEAFRKQASLQLDPPQYRIFSKFCKENLRREFETDEIIVEISLPYLSSELLSRYGTEMYFEVNGARGFCYRMRFPIAIQYFPQMKWTGFIQAYPGTIELADFIQEIMDEIVENDDELIPDRLQQLLRSFASMEPHWNQIEVKYQNGELIFNGSKVDGFLMPGEV